MGLLVFGVGLWSHFRSYSRCCQLHHSLAWGRLSILVFECLQVSNLFYMQPHGTCRWCYSTLRGYGPPIHCHFKVIKLLMLMALTRPSHSADLDSFQLDRCRYKPEGVAFLPSALAKQSSQGKILREFFFPSFPHNVVQWKPRGNMRSLQLPFEQVILTGNQKAL